MNSSAITNNPELLLVAYAALFMVFWFLTPKAGRPTPPDPSHLRYSPRSAEDRGRWQEEWAKNFEAELEFQDRLARSLAKPAILMIALALCSPAWKALRQMPVSSWSWHEAGGSLGEALVSRAQVGVIIDCH